MKRHGFDRKRGQSSSEFIVLLAITLVLLAGITVFVLTNQSDASTLLDNANSLSTRSYAVGITDVVYSPKGISFRMINNLNAPVHVTAVSLSGQSLSSTQFPFVLLPGEDRRFYSYDVYLNTSDTFRDTISITYTQSDLSKDTGNIPVEGFSSALASYEIEEDEALADNMTFLLRFNNDSYLGEGSSTFVDSVSGLTGSCTTCPGLESGFTTAGNFSGLDALTFSVPFDNTSHTVSFWATNSSAADQYIFEAMGATFGFGVFVTDGNGVGILTAGGSASGSVDTVNPWNHFVLTVNNTGGSLYVNNNLVRTISTSILIPADSTLVIGEYESDYFAGNLDEFAIWNRTLSAGERESLYRRGVANFGYS